MSELEIKFKVIKALGTFTPAEMLEFFESRIQGQGEQLAKAVYRVYNYLELVAAGKLKQADNWLLTAPSGCGKTEFYRAARDFFKEYDILIPVIQFDLSHFTEPGYKGDEPTSIADRILDENSGCGGIAICFLDETDKKLIPSYDSREQNTNIFIQHSILTLVEGIERTNKDGDKIDTSKTMFVFMGAFSDLRNKRTHGDDRKRIGFGAEIEPDEKDFSENFYSEITLDDIMEYGMIEELAGRIGMVINFRRLSKAAMKQIIESKKNEIARELGVVIEIKKKARGEILGMSFGPLGVRQPINMIKSLACDALARSFFTPDFRKETAKIVIENLETARVENRKNPALKELRGTRNG